ncbi:metal-dependent hydrolase [Pannus brasiliensis CCIBt3594]|uniref:Metal-dependent hydrolase n=1 Tax=Pannus brasiliensis CCIBt3594 TaxID=1427578 RepID=A0AAW9R1P7_9CHRO
MMTVTHLITGSLGTALILQSAEPAVLLVGAIAALFPDIDISTSPIGRIFPPVSHFLEKRFPHRSATHSLLASGLLGVISYAICWKFSVGWEYVHALNIGYFFGWFLDCFTKSGVEAFYPVSVRCVCPGNRNLRFSTASPQEYWLIAILAAIAIWVFQINSEGGLMSAFNRAIAAPSGVEELYNQKGGTNLIVANVDGVFAIDRTPVKGDFPIVATDGQGFILLGVNGEIYKVGNDPDSNIIPHRITAKVEGTAVIQVENVNFIDEDLTKLSKYRDKQAYLSGSVSIDDPESAIAPQHPREWKAIEISGSTATLNNAPIGQVASVLGDQYLSGSVSVRSIYVR